MRGRWVHVAAGGALFLLALALRLHFFCGYVLGDDPIEYAALMSIHRHGPIWTDQLHLPAHNVGDAPRSLFTVLALLVLSLRDALLKWQQRLFRRLTNGPDDRRAALQQRMEILLCEPML